MIEVVGEASLLLVIDKFCVYKRENWVLIPLSFVTLLKYLKMQAKKNLNSTLRVVNTRKFPEGRTKKVKFLKFSLSLKLES